MLLVAWLAALVLAQTFGQLHRHAHPAGEAGGAVALAAAADGREGASLLSLLFGGHDADRPQCELYDHLAHADALCTVAALDVPSRVPTHAATPHGSVRLASPSPVFRARGPPTPA